MACPDLCTAAKCAELEARIGQLENALALLEASFEAHVAQPIPEAHKYTPPKSNLKIGASFQSEILTISVADGESQDTAQVNIPLPEPTEHVESNLSISASWQSEILTISVADGKSQDTAQVNIPLPEIPEPIDPHVESNLKISASWQSEVLTISVADGESQDTAQVQIPLLEPTEHVKSNLRLDGSFRNNVLTLTVADGKSFDTATIFIPTDDTPQTIFITEEVYMNCDELERKINECCEQIINEINRSQNIIVAEIEESENNLKNEIDSAQNIITGDIKTVEDYLTVDISGTISTGVCEVPSDDDGNPLPLKQTVELTSNDYSNPGLTGLNDALQLIEQKLTAILANTCAAIEPDLRVNLDELANHCDYNLPLREDYSSDVAWFEAVKTGISGFLSGSTLKVLVNTLKITPGSPVTFGVTATASYIYKHLLDQTFKQEKIAYNDICAKLEELEDPDVVSLVASDKVTKRADGKFLVLHFVTPGNYPKRSRNSTYWPVQIPAALDEYDWCEHFETLTWSRGNCFAELRFREFNNPVSGFFKDKNAADEYFDRVLGLTTATEKNRVYHEHKSPQTNIVERFTRPYRAFIESVNGAGQAVCHVKYVPPKEPCE